MTQTNGELADLYIRQAREQEALADARKAEIRRSVELTEMHTRITPTQRREMGESEYRRYIDGITTSKCSGSRNSPPDPIWQKHVSLNQWYIQQAIMYGTRANGDLLQRQNALLSQILDRLTGTNTGRQIFSSAVTP